MTCHIIKRSFRNGFADGRTKEPLPKKARLADLGGTPFVMSPAHCSSNGVNRRARRYRVPRLTAEREQISLVSHGSRTVWLLRDSSSRRSDPAVSSLSDSVDTESEQPCCSNGKQE